MATKSPTQHHSYWGNFAGAANLPNLAASPVQDAALQTGDTAFDSIGGLLYVCTDATLGAAVWVALGAGAASSLMTWNGVDLTQFGAPVTLTGALGTAVLSVVPDTHLANKNRLQIALTGWRGWKWWPLLDDAGSPLLLPERYQFRVMVNAANLGTASDNFCLLLNTNLAAGMLDTDLFGVQYDIDTNGTQYLIEAGVRITTSMGSLSSWATGFNGDTGGLHQTQWWRGPDPQPDASCDFYTFRNAWSGGANGTDAVGTQQYSGHAFSAGWTGLTLSRAGIGISNPVNTVNGNWQCSELAFFLHPLDGGP
jgi:hypothetical protein